MIRHRPAGSGHPYRTDADQRVPVQPVAGEPLELRATTDALVRDLAVELDVDGRREVRHASRRIPASSDLAAPGAITGSHLEAAALRLTGRRRTAWAVQLEGLPGGTRLRYRFVDASDGARDPAARSRWHECSIARWQPSGGRLVIDGDRALLDPSSVAWLVADRGPVRVRFSLRLDAGAHVVGFGERFDHLDQRGRRFDAVVFEQYRSQGSRTYMPMPFAIVVEGDGQSWGFHVRTSRRTWYDVGASDPERLWIEAALDPDDEEPTLEVAIYAGAPAEILRSFVAETGGARLPPDWVFRPWISSNEWNTQARVQAEVERSLAAGIPVGVVVIEAWSDESTFVAFRDAQYEVHEDGAPHVLGEFTFPGEGAWPDPRGLVEWLHARDIRLLLWQVPLLRARPAPVGQARADRDTMVRRRLAVREASGLPYRNHGWWFPGGLLPDWTNPAAKEWWLAKRRYLVDEVGIDGFKTEGGEHAWGDDLRYADGSRGDATNNRYPVLYAEAYHELMESLGRDPVTFSRAGFTGAAAVPCHWAGDEASTWEAFRASIIAGLTAGASGVSLWGWDLGGFSGEVPTAELYMRATAAACFTPIMQYHSEFNHHRKPSRDRTPWNIAERTGDGQVIAVFRRFAQLRERLVPYLVEQAARSVASGLPLMRALFFEWPDEPSIWDHPTQYLLGNDLLVAPVLEPGVDRVDVFVPAGEWLDAWSGELLSGPTVVSRPAPIDEMAVLVRGGDTRGLVHMLRTAT